MKRGRKSLIHERLIWDWTQSNSALAQEYNISRERVRQIRGKLGLPPWIFKSSGPKKKDNFKQAQNLTNEEWAMYSNREIARILDIHEITAAKWRAKLGQPPSVSKGCAPFYKYEKVDWNWPLYKIIGKLKANQFTICMMRQRVLKKLGMNIDLRKATAEEKREAAEKLNDYFAAK